MLARIAASRDLISSAVAAAVSISAWFLHPFPERNLLRELIHLERPAIHLAIGWAYIVMWFTTPSERMGQIGFLGRSPSMRSKRKEQPT